MTSPLRARPTTAAAEAACDCPPEDAYHDGMSRRSLLRAGLIAGALGTTMTVAGPDSFSRYAFAAPGYTGDTLVVLSLRGGFDGLGAVAPVGDPGWAAQRPNIGLTPATALQLDGAFGLNPAMSALMPFWQNRTLGIAHDVGQAAPTRSHFDAMAEMERAAPGSGLRTGWLERTLGDREAGSPFQAAQVGSNSVSPALAGPLPEMALQKIDNTAISGGGDATERLRWATALRAMHVGAPASLSSPTSTALSALDTLEPVRTSTVGPANGAAYPTTSTGALTDLASSLRDVVRLVKGGVGLQVACVDWGDWDMHVGAGNPGAGWMYGKLRELSLALAAFATDLGPTLMQSTTLVTMSEFGRRVAQNGSGGTDHGHGNAVFVLGGNVNGGVVHGSWRGATTVLSQGDLPGNTDYRLLLGEILTRRCGAPSLANVFPGLTGTPLGIVKPRQ